MKADEILGYAKTQGIRLWADGSLLHIDAPRDAMSADLRDAMKQCKWDLIKALRGFDERKDAPSDADSKQKLCFVTCNSCSNWTGKSQCDAGFNTSGDYGAAKGIHLCGRHAPRRAQ